MTPTHANRQRRAISALLALLVLALGAVVAGCGDDDDDSGGGGDRAPRGTFTGKVGGSDELVAVVVGEKRVVAYVCDGKRVGVRFDGENSGDKLELTSAAGKKLTADFSGDEATGEVALDGGDGGSFTASKSGPDTGYYRASGTAKGFTYSIGWVVISPTEQVGVQRRVRGKVEQAKLIEEAVSSAPMLSAEQVVRPGGNVNLPGIGTAIIDHVVDEKVDQFTGPDG